ncbi:fibronectin type III-like domain-contianing protein [Streptomyces griseochromogenes]|nr:fibronectin type III-like domain-contianing protein [Streptomyces griseochromogenes]
MRLEPGHSGEVTFRLPSERMAHWDVATGAFTVDPGRYEVLLARSAADIVLSAPLTVSGTQAAPRALVSRRTLAADFDDYTDVSLVDATRARGDAVAPADPAHPATLLFRAADLSGAARFEAEVARDRRTG